MDLLSERDNARPELKEMRRLRQVETEELKIVKASRDSLPTGFDESEKKVKEGTKILEALNKKVADLKGSLKEREHAFAAYKVGIGRYVRWRSSRYNYVGF